MTEQPWIFVLFIFSIWESINFMMNGSKGSKENGTYDSVIQIDDQPLGGEKNGSEASEVSLSVSRTSKTLNPFLSVSSK